MEFPVKFKTGDIIKINNFRFQNEIARVINIGNPFSSQYNLLDVALIFSGRKLVLGESEVDLYYNKLFDLVIK
jgi:hypothetical protein